MRKIFVGLGAVFTLSLCGLYYYYFYPPSLYRHALQRMLDRLSLSLSSQNRDLFENTLSSALADPAEITLQINFPSPPGQQQTNSEKEVFKKPDFLRFTDNVLFSLKDYRFNAKAGAISLSNDKKSALLELNGEADAEGLDSSTTDGNIRYHGDFLCHSGLTYNDTNAPKFSSLSCVVEMKYALKR